MTKPAPNQQGFSLIEVVITLAILSMATVALGLVQLSNAKRAEEMKSRSVAFARAQAFLERISRMPFGNPDMPAATPADFDKIFGTNDDIRHLRLTQLERKDTDGDGVVDQEPIRFTLKGTEDAGVWEIFIDRDVNGDGTIGGAIVGAGVIENDGGEGGEEPPEEEPPPEGEEGGEGGEVGGVNVDIDGDGENDMVDGAGVEGQADIFRIVIRHNGRVVLRTIRTRSPQETEDG